MQLMKEARRVHIMAGAFPISNSKFETLGIKSIQILLFQKVFQVKNLQDK